MFLFNILVIWGFNLMNIKNSHKWNNACWQRHFFKNSSELKSWMVPIMFDLRRVCCGNNCHCKIWTDLRIQYTARLPLYHAYQAAFRMLNCEQRVASPFLLTASTTKWTLKGLNFITTKYECCLWIQYTFAVIYTTQHIWVYKASEKDVSVGTYF